MTGVQTCALPILNHLADNILGRGNLISQEMIRNVKTNQINDIKSFCNEEKHSYFKYFEALNVHNQSQTNYYLKISVK